jgi:DNA polymerase III delta prime subunit
LTFSKNEKSAFLFQITSRTAKFRFRLLPKEIQNNQIQHIKEAENVQISENAVEELISGFNPFKKIA